MVSLSPYIFLFTDNHLLYISSFAFIRHFFSYSNPFFCIITSFGVCVWNPRGSGKGESNGCWYLFCSKVGHAGLHHMAVAVGILCGSG